MPILVHAYAPSHDVPNLSPFCCKLVAWLRLAGVEHELAEVTDARRSPTRTIPWITDGDRVIGDTTEIIAHLVRTRGVDPDAGLTAEQRAIALTVQRTLEEHGKWLTAYRLFVSDVGWAVTRTIMDPVPALFRPLVANRFLRGRIRKQLWAQGLGRHPHATRMRRGCEDWTAISALLGDRPWLLGDRPRTIDATVYGFLASVVRTPIDDEIRRHVLGLPNLVAYVDRATRAWFPELAAPASAAA